MQPRIQYAKVAPGAMTAMLGLETYVLHCGLERSLIELVKLRASQINGCAYCVDMHTKDARAEGETEQRLYAVSVWEEAPFFTSVKEPHSPGRRRSRWSAKSMYRMMFTSKLAAVSAKPNWLT